MRRHPRHGRKPRVGLMRRRPPPLPAVAAQLAADAAPTRSGQNPPPGDPGRAFRPDQPPGRGPPDPCPPTSARPVPPKRRAGPAFEYQTRTRPT